MIKEIFSFEEKSTICSTILRALPDWFGNEQSIEGYIESVRDKPFFCAFDNGKAIGFVSLEIHNAHTCEIHVMGVLESYHGRGVGRSFVERCVSFCQTRGADFLTVKTLDESANYAPYDRTRKFYLSMGFKPLQVFPLFWDEDNPCLLMARYVGRY